MAAACMWLGVHGMSAQAESPVIHGNIVGPAAWVDYTSGIYTFSAQAPLTLEMQKESRFIAVNGGGDNVDGLYHYISNNDGLGTSYSYRMYVYDAATWIPKGNFRVPGNYCATDLSYDRTTGRLYGCFTDDNSVFTFGWMEPSTGEFTAVGRIPGSYSVVAVNRLGQVYAVNQDGTLMLVNKSTGEETAVGSTGLAPGGSQSGCFDPDSDTLYWCFRDNDDHTALYSVDISTADAALIGAFPMDEVVTGVYIEPSAADEASAPAAVADLSTAVRSGHMEITFTMPGHTLSGAPLGRELSYVLLIDGIVAAEGTAASGEEINHTAAIADGGHIVTVIAFNGQAQGGHATQTFFAGPDIPSAPEGLKALREGPVFKASWCAPSTGVNGGDVDFGNICYEVVFHNGDEVSHYTTRETCFTAEPLLAAPAECYVEVTAADGDRRSEAVKSGSVLMGPGLPLPYSQNFDTGEGTELFMALDANADGCTWQHDKVFGDMRTAYKTGDGDMDDWLFTPNFEMTPQMFYHVQARVTTAGVSYPETLEIKAGLNRTPEDMTVEVMAPTEIATTSAGRTVDVYFVPSEAGCWHVGFHSITAGENLYLAVDNLKIERGGVTTAPASPSEIKAIPAAGGELKCTITMVAPSVCLDGDPLDENVTVQIYRSGRKQKEVAGVAPGTALTIEDVAGVQGTNTYEIRCFNSDGYGIPVETSAYLGVDRPLPPRNVRLEFNKEGKPVVNWDAPEGGVNGGVIDYDALTYSVRRSFDGRYIATGIKGTTAVDELGLDYVEQALMYYKVCATTDAGTGDAAESEHFTMGRPYALPYFESFKDMQEMKGPWLGMLLDNQKGAWYVDGAGARPSAEPFDNNGGLVTFAPSEPLHTSTLATPLVCIDDAEYPVAEFYFYTVGDNDSRLTVSVRTADTEAEALWSRRMNDRTFSAGWNVARIPLEEYKGEQYVQVMFTGTAGEAYGNHIHLDCIGIADMPRYDVAARGLVAPDVILPGEEAIFCATVANVGMDAVKNVSVILMCGPDEVDRVEIPTLEANMVIDVTLVDTAELDSEQFRNYSFRVDAPRDTNPTNDLSRVAEVEVDLPHYPVPVLKGHIEGAEAVLTWEQPATEGVRAPVCDGFESYQPFVIDNVGDWTMYDVDGSGTVQLVDGTNTPVEYPNAGKPMAFQVFNPGEAGLVLVDEDGNPTVCATHRGNQMMCAFCDLDAYNNDWLVSPRLSGDSQTVSFYARSFVGSYGREAMIIMVSDKGTGIADFREYTGVVEVPVDWTRYVVDLPAGTRHFAIRCISVDQLALCVDDVRFIPESSAPVDLVLSGYNLYADGRLVERLAADATEYRIASGSAAGSYRISAVYHLGESAHSPAVDVSELAGVEDVVAVEKEHDGPVAIYTMQGVCLSRNATRRDVENLSPGIYVVGNRKIVVK